MSYFYVNGVRVHIADNIRTGYYIVQDGRIVAVDVSGQPA